MNTPLRKDNLTDVLHPVSQPNTSGNQTPQPSNNNQSQSNGNTGKPATTATGRDGETISLGQTSGDLNKSK